VPYRLDIDNPPDTALDTLVAFGALDVDRMSAGIAAIMPDGVTPETIVEALGACRCAVSPAVGRDNDSVWVLAPRLVRVGRLVVAPEHVEAPPDAIRLTDDAAFGTGLHPTTALCLEALEQAVDACAPDRVLDVGIGSGVLALAALRLGVPRATGLDTDAGALQAAARNARLNRLDDRLDLVSGGPGDVDGQWPLVLANILAAPLIELAPQLVRRLGRAGRLVLSGIPDAVAPEVERAYRRSGLTVVARTSRAGWSALILDATW
jgi:ribosomal protein L11 methyltransferase